MGVCLNLMSNNMSNLLQIIGKIKVKNLPASCSSCNFVKDDWSCCITGLFYTSHVDRNPECPLISNSEKHKCYSPNCNRNAPANDIFCKKHR